MTVLRAYIVLGQDMTKKNNDRFESLIRSGKSAAAAFTELSAEEKMTLYASFGETSAKGSQQSERTDGSAYLSYSDGASRGNPGEAGYGYVIEKDGVVIKEGCGYLGVMTNNQAEYHGLINLLRQAAALGIMSLTVRMDSELIVRQMTGQYKVRNDDLKMLSAEAAALSSMIGTCRFEHVKRTFNKKADALANLAIDEKKI